MSLKSTAPRRILTITKAADRLFNKLPKQAQKRLKAEAQVLRSDPMKGSLLQGKHKSLRSLHVITNSVHYRIIYGFSETEVTIHLATTRENIYRKLQEIH